MCSGLALRLDSRSPPRVLPTMHPILLAKDIRPQGRLSLVRFCEIESAPAHHVSDIPNLDPLKCGYGICGLACIYGDLGFVGSVN